MSHTKNNGGNPTRQPGCPQHPVASNTLLRDAIARKKLPRNQSNIGGSQYIQTSQNVTMANAILHSVVYSNNHGTIIRRGKHLYSKGVLARVYVITDDEDPEYSKLMPEDHLIDTGCANGHGREDLCCKMGYELKSMVRHVDSYRWFCRADDDTYYNDVGIVAELNRHNWTKSYIIGRLYIHGSAIEKGDKFKTANGNAGVCMSRPLVHNIAPHVMRSKFLNFCMNKSLNDDVALNVLAHLYGKSELLEAKTMFNHGEKAGRHKMPLSEIATLNYRDRGGVIQQPCLNNLSPSFKLSSDQTRMYTLHCHLHPQVDYCKELFPNGTNPNYKR